MLWVSQWCANTWKEHLSCRERSLLQWRQNCEGITQTWALYVFFIFHFQFCQLYFLLVCPQHTCLIVIPPQEWKKDCPKAEALGSFVSEAASHAVSKLKIALEAQLTFLHRSHSFCIPSAEKTEQNQSPPCATTPRPTCIFSEVSMFQQTSRVFGARGKRSERAVVPGEMPWQENRVAGPCVPPRSVRHLPWREHVL